MSEEYALFDFCGTIVDFQSFNPYIEELLKNERPRVYRVYRNKLVAFLILIITKIINKINSDFYFNKHLLVFLTKGIPVQSFEKVAERYYEENVSKRFVNEVIELLMECHRKNVKIIIVSAGCDQYITKITSIVDIEYIIANEIKFKNGKSVGCLKNKDLLGKRKVSAIQKLMDERYIRPHYILGVSDSSSDKPLLNICDKKIVISKKCHQRWVTDEYEEIIYE